jgi:crotonobetainyl-CoA:carnitine CoA-transferase CaiB-like acyl-CoA transferase
MTSITPFGLSGPRRWWQASPLTLFAMSSRMRVHGKPDRYPLQYAPDTVPFQAGATAAAATATALVGRDDSGGRLIEVAVLEALIANVDVLTILASFTGVLSQRGLYPSMTYPCKDGFIILSFQDRAISGIIAAMGRPELASDPRFVNRAAYVANQEEFDAYLQPWLFDHTREELFEVLQANHVMCAPVADFIDVLQDKHYNARGFLRRVDDPVLGPTTMPGSVFGPNCQSAGTAPAPEPGQATEQVFEEMLGLDATTMARLRAARVI